jgi:hypothetical protein
MGASLERVSARKIRNFAACIRLRQMPGDDAAETEGCPSHSRNDPDPDTLTPVDAFERLAVVNRYNPPPPLQLSLPLGEAIDCAYCEHISRSLLAKGKWQVHEATKTLAEHLPDEPGLYLFVWRFPFPMPTNTDKSMHMRSVLYVGQAGADNTTGTLRKRYRDEYASIVGADPESLWTEDMANRSSRLTRILNLRHLEYWHIVNQSRDHLRSYESQLIRLFNPPGNTQSANGCRESSKTISATIRQPIPAF